MIFIWSLYQSQTNAIKALASQTILQNKPLWLSGGTESTDFDQIKVIELKTQSRESKSKAINLGFIEITLSSLPPRENQLMQDKASLPK